MAAPSAPVIQNVSTAYWFGSNVRAEWVTLADVTSCSATLTLPDGTTQSEAVILADTDGYTTRWVARPAPASVGRYVLSVTATNADGTSGAGTATFMVVDYPIIVISPANGSTVTGLPLDISWVISDSTGIATQRIRITDSGGATIYSIEPNNNIRTLSLGVAELAGIEDGASYAIWLDMTNGVGLSMSAHSTITTSWQPPVTPTATVTTDPDTLAASVTVTAGTGTPATDTLMVVRVNPDGTRHVLADDLESGDTVTDPLPPLGVEYSYEVTGIAATGVPSEPAIVQHTNATTCWAMNFGTGAAEVVLARFNPKASYSVEQGGELYHFADGGEGDGMPVWYGTTERDVGGAATWDTLTHATADRLNALMLRYPVGWLRDPFGHRWRAHMKPKFSHGIGKLWQVSIDWDAVRWVEA